MQECCAFDCSRSGCASCSPAVEFPGFFTPPLGRKPSQSVSRPRWGPTTTSSRLTVVTATWSPRAGSLRGLMAESAARRTGSVTARAARMHIADLSVAISARTACSRPAARLARASRCPSSTAGRGRWRSAFFGDGAANRGPFHEGVNMAALGGAAGDLLLREQPVGVDHRPSESAAGGSIAGRAAGYGIPGESVDGNDVLAVHDAVTRAADRARRGGGPLADRGQDYPLGRPLRGRSASVPRQGRGGGRRARDPIARLGRRRRRAAARRPAHRADPRGRQAEIDEAVAHGEDSPLPEPDEALDRSVRLLAL